MNAEIHINGSRQVGLSNGVLGRQAGGGRPAGVHLLTAQTETAAAAGTANAQKEARGDARPTIPSFVTNVNTSATVRFQLVCHFSPSEYRVFCLLGKGLSQTQIASIHVAGVPRSRKTISTQVSKMRHLTGLSYVSLVAMAAAYVESGLQRVPNPHYAPYVFKT